VSAENGATKSPEPTSDEFAQALAAEEEIAAAAAEIRDEADGELSADLFLRLWPLLRKPIPAAFIQKIGTTKGKPYESTGIRSVQVQIDRMNNVLTPMHWRVLQSCNENGTVCEVTVLVGNGLWGDEADREIFAEGSSYGGVDRGSTAGNVFKGSFTNAAKPAFARVGPGHEVYLGAADLDPDVNHEVADESGKAKAGNPADDAEIGLSIAGKLVDRAWKIPAARKSLQLAASHAAGRDVGDCSTPKGATEGLVGLTYPQAEKLERWISKKETETEAEVDAPAEKQDGEE
jgi:hypothetical protein